MYLAQCCIKWQISGDYTYKFRFLASFDKSQKSEWQWAGIPTCHCELELSLSLESWLILQAWWGPSAFLHSRTITCTCYMYLQPLPFHRLQLLLMHCDGISFCPLTLHSRSVSVLAAGIIADPCCHNCGFRTAVMRAKTYREKGDERREQPRPVACSVCHLDSDCLFIF